MKIFKFYESKSRQVEWLDDEIFTLRELTGELTKKEKRDDATLLHYQKGTTALMLPGNDPFEWRSWGSPPTPSMSYEDNSILDLEFVLKFIDKTKSEDYFLFHMWNVSNVLGDDDPYSNGDDLSMAIIGVFDKSGALIFLSQSRYGSQYGTIYVSLIDNLYIEHTSGNHIIVFDMNTKELYMTTKDFKIPQWELSNRIQIKDN